MVSSKLRPHFTPGKDPVPLLQEARWAPGPVWTGGKSRSHQVSIPDRPARSQSPYLLSYQAYTIVIKPQKKFKGGCHGTIRQGCTNPGRQVSLTTKFCMVALNYLWVFSMKRASCRPSGAKGFERASGFLENLCTRPVCRLSHCHYTVELPSPVYVKIATSPFSER